MKKMGALLFALLVSAVISPPASAVPPYCIDGCHSTQICYCQRTCQVTNCNGCFGIDSGGDWPLAPAFGQAPDTISEITTAGELEVSAEIVATRETEDSSALAAPEALED